MQICNAHTYASDGHFLDACMPSMMCVNLLWLPLAWEQFVHGMLVAVAASPGDVRPHQ